MSQKAKSALIALISFIGGLLSGLVGAPYTGLVDAGTKVAVEVVEAVPTTPAPVETPAAPEQTEAKDAVVEHVTDDAALVVPAPVAPAAK